MEFAGEPKAAHLGIQIAAMKILVPVVFLCPSMEKNDSDPPVFELHVMIYGEVAEQGF